MPAAHLATNRARRTLLRNIRTTMERYDEMPSIAVDLVADDADDELAEPNAELLSQLFASDRIVGPLRFVMNNGCLVSHC